MRAGVVTPEAVVLDLPTAGVATRGFARAVDIVVQLILLTVLTFAAGWLALAGVGEALVFLAVFVFVLVVWPIGMEILWRGRSVGKALFGLRVIGAEGSPVQPRQSVVRGLLALIEIYLTLGFLALITAMFSPVSQRLGDLGAQTVVIREPRRNTGAVPVVFYPPAGFESYVSTLDVGRLRPDDFALVREFLLRVASLRPQARQEEAMALAEGVRQRIGHTVPGQVNPETWLVCVASAYQWREGGLLRDVALGVAPVLAPGSPVAPGAPVAAARR